MALKRRVRAVHCGALRSLFRWTPKNPSRLESLQSTLSCYVIVKLVPTDVFYFILCMYSIKSALIAVVVFFIRCRDDRKFFRRVQIVNEPREMLTLLPASLSNDADDATKRHDDGASRSAGQNAQSDQIASSVRQPKRFCFFDDFFFGHFDFFIFIRWRFFFFILDDRFLFY